MAQTKSPQGGLTRRNFLKTTGAVAGVGALAGTAAPALQALAVDYEQGPKESEGEQIFRGVCRPNCFGFCHLNVHVRDGNIVKTSRAPYKNEQYNRICHRGLSHVQRVYDPERLKYPLRRVEGTERGAGEWERISWDEALDEVAEKIQAAQGQYGPQAFSFFTASGNQAFVTTGMYGRLQALLQAGSIAPCLDFASYYGMMRMTGPLTQLWESNEQTDMINAKTIVTWGANVTDAQVQSWHFLKEAQQNGTKLVVIDPTFTQVASKADLWIPIRPGADMPLYMGLMNIFVEKDEVNVEFMQKSTVGPFLVKSDTGLFLRRSDMGVEPTATGQIHPLTQEEIMYDPYMVISGGALTPLEEAVSPDLEATYDLNGVKCRTAYSLLKDEIAKFPPEEVSKLTDIPVDTIYELADICLDQPVTHYVGYGPQAYMNGVHTTHAGLTMSALIGNLGYPGASYGAFWHVYFWGNPAFTSPEGPNLTPAINQVDFAQVMRTGKHMGEDFPVKMIYVYSANPLCTCCDTNALLDDVWSQLDYVVVADSMMTDTARYADMVLPVAQWFEGFDATNAGQTTSINLSEKAIEPLYESKTDSDIVRMLSDKLGFGKYFQMSDEEALEDLLDADMSRAIGLTMDTLKKEKEVRMVADEPHIAWAGGTGFTSPSGRLEFYLENPMPRGASSKEITPELIERERLPHWFPPEEAWPESEAYKKYPLIFMSERPRYRVHSQWYNTPVLRELDPEPTIKINPLDAQERGIEDGDYVECYNDRGYGVGKAIFSEAIRPGTLVYPKSWQMSQHKAGGWSELLSTDYDAFGVNGNFMDATCEIRVWNEGGAQ